MHAGGLGIANHASRAYFAGGVARGRGTWESKWGSRTELQEQEATTWPLLELDEMEQLLQPSLQQTVSPDQAAPPGLEFGVGGLQSRRTSRQRAI